MTHAGRGKPARTADFADTYARMAAGPMAAFFLHAWAKRHHATGFDELIGCQLSRVTDGVRTTRGLRTEDA